MKEIIIVMNSILSVTLISPNHVCCIDKKEPLRFLNVSIFFNANIYFIPIIPCLAEGVFGFFRTNRAEREYKIHVAFSTKVINQFYEEISYPYRL